MRVKSFAKDLARENLTLYYLKVSLRILNVSNNHTNTLRCIQNSHKQRLQKQCPLQESNQTVLWLQFKDFRLAHRYFLRVGKTLLYEGAHCPSCVGLLVRILPSGDQHVVVSVPAVAFTFSLRIFQCWYITRSAILSCDAGAIFPWTLDLILWPIFYRTG